MAFIDPGNADCTTGLSKRIYERMLRDTRIYPLQPQMQKELKATCYSTALGVADEINSKGGVGGDGGGGTVVLPSSSTPLMDGAGFVGIETGYARGDHRHPTDTTRAPLDSPEFLNTPTAPTPASGDASTRLATTAFVQDAVAAGGGGGGTPTGWTLDADTVALWRMNERSGLTVADEVGAYPLAINGGPGIARGPIDYARWFDSAGRWLSGAGSSALNSVFSGECTVDIWLQPREVFSGVVVFAYGIASGNHIFQINGETGQLFRPLYNAGSTIYDVFSVNAAPVFGWTLLTARKRTDGTNWFLDVLLDGVLDATSAPLPNVVPTAGSNNIIVGRFNNSGANGWPGLIGPMRISSVARSDAETLAAYRAGMGLA